MNVNGLIQPHHIGDLAQAIVYGLILPHHISQVLIPLLVLIPNQCETTSRQMATLNALLVSICAEQI